MTSDRLRMFALGAASLMFEVLLTRIAAVTLFANLAFAVIALSLLGLAAGSAWAERKNFAADEDRDRAIRQALLAAAIVALVSAVLASSLPLVPVEMTVHGKLVSTYNTRRTAFDMDPSQAHWGWIALVVLAQGTPFALTGYAQALIFGRPAAAVSVLYAFDLAGATLGAFATLGLLRWFGAVDAIGVAGILFVGAALADRLATRKKEQAAAVLGLVASIAILAFRPLEIRYAAGYSNDDVVAVDWSALARVTLLGTEKRLAVDNTSSTEVAFAHDDRFGTNLERIPYLLRTDGDVLVIGAGGGQEVETALATAPERKRHVDAIELADGEERLMRASYGKRSDFLLSQPGVNYQIADGRSYLETTSRTWDVIQMKEVNFHTYAGQAAAAWSPNLLFTVEAFRLQIAHLKPNGFLAVTKGIYGSNDSSGSVEVVATLSAATRDLSSRLVIVDRPWPGGKQRLYLVGAAPLAADELARVDEIAQSTGLHVVRTPRRPSKIFEDAVNGRSEARPPTDDHPFGRGGRQQSDQRMIGWAIVALTFLASVLFGTSVSKIPRRRRSVGIRQLVMCGLLGIGFMLLEVVLVERTSLLLGHPTVAFAVVVTSLLCALGVGSLLSGKLLPEARLGRTAAVAAFTLLAVVGSSQALTAATDVLRACGSTLRVVVIALALFAASIPLGMLLPSAIRIAKATGAATAAGCWSSNAALSVLGTLVAALLVRSRGFELTNHVTWLIYVAALALWFSIARAQKNPLAETVPPSGTGLTPIQTGRCRRSSSR